MSALRFQVVVLGSGFGGSLMAMAAHRLGLATALVERGRHPRFVIGESSTPLANLLLEEIAGEYALPFVRPLCKWGSWQQKTRQIACGIKRGFTFYHHQTGRHFAPDPERRRELLVGASPNENVADTHWYRPEFDHYLVQQAQALGVTYWDQVEITAITEQPDGLRLAGKRPGQSLELAGEFVIDASGPRGCLYRALAYPPEQAAVHHIFPGGWVWVLKFNNGLTSAGVAATDPQARALEFQAGAPAWKRLLEQFPSLAEIFGSARAVVPFVHQPRIAFRSAAVSGRRWALLPSAAGVIDPLLSTGFPLTLLGICRLARLLASHWLRPSFHAELREYAQLTALELETTARLIGALYATMDRFELFQQLSLLYFAAASFSEAARRLGKLHLADSFLLCRHPVFSAQLRQFCDAASQPLSARNAGSLARHIGEAIQPFDVAGLTDRSRHPWYPSLTADLFRNAHKLGASQTEIAAMVKKCE